MKKSVFKLTDDQKFTVSRLITPLFDKWGAIKLLSVWHDRLHISLALYHPVDAPELSDSIVYELVFYLNGDQWIESEHQINYVGIVASMREIADKLSTMPIISVEDDLDKLALGSLAVRRRIEPVFVQDDSDYSSPFMRSMLFGYQVVYD